MKIHNIMIINLYFIHMTWRMDKLVPFTEEPGTVFLLGLGSGMYYRLCLLLSIHNVFLNCLKDVLKTL